MKKIKIKIAHTYLTMKFTLSYVFNGRNNNCANTEIHLHLYPSCAKCYIEKACAFSAQIQLKVQIKNYSVAISMLRLNLIFCENDKRKGRNAIC